MILQAIVQGFKQTWQYKRIVVLLYLMTFLLAAFVALIATREDLAATVTRFRGMTYQARDTGQISNLSEVSFINKTFDAQKVALVSENEKYAVEVVGDQNWTLDGQAKFNGRFFLVKDQKDMLVNQEDVTLLLMQNGQVIDKIRTSFVGPVFSGQ